MYLEVGERLLNNHPILVVDIISLVTFHGLNCRDNLLGFVGKLGITQSTVDYIHRLIERRKIARTKGLLTVGKEGDEFVRQEISAEDIQRNIAYLEELLGWASEHCEILPVNAALKVERAYRNSLEKLMDASFSDTLLVASEQGKVLYSDDERLRALAKGEFKAEGVWTQVLLTSALKAEAIDVSAYNQAIIKLVCSNCYYVHINATVIVEAARQAEWRPSYPYSKVIQGLTGGRCEETFALDVATETLYSIWLEPLMAHQKQFLAGALLEVLVTARKRIPILEQLFSRVRQNFRYIPIQSNDVLAFIIAWNGTRIL